MNELNTVLNNQSTNNIVNKKHFNLFSNSIVLRTFQLYPLNHGQQMMLNNGLDL